ncbi:MAG: tetratricopeptide repeat protein [Nostocales cyanobacterium 94392]|nr:tetratricopeptide repeat protein [Nostocales cyanobacterium 94392]
MKGLKTVSAIALLGFMVISPRVNAQKLPDTNIKPQIERMQVESNPDQNLTQDEQKAATYLEEGIKLFQAEKYREAIETFNEVIKIQPNNQYAYLFKGASYFQLKEYQQAKTDLDKSIELDDSISYSYLFRGVTNAALGNKDNAIADLETAEKLFEKDGNTELAQTSRNVIEQIRNA